MRTPVQCHATSRRSGQRCRRFCPPFQQVCSFHGAKSGQAIRKANERGAQAEAARHLELLGVVEPVADPIGQLQLLAAEAQALLSYCRGRFVSTDSIEWLAVWGKALIDTQRQLSDLAKLLPAHETVREQVQAEISDEQYSTIVGAFEAAMSDPEVALTDAQIHRAKAVVGSHFGGAPAPPARRGVRGAETALSVLAAVRRRGANYGGWSAEEREDVDAIQRAASALLSVLGEPVDVVEGALESTPQLALEPVIADAEVVGEVQS